MEGLIWLHNTFHQIDWLNSLAKFFTMLGDIGFIWILLALVLMIFKKTRTGGFVMLVSLGFGYVLNDLILKNIFERVRPFNECEELKEFILNLGIKLPTSNSFPSGHSFSSFNCAVVLMLFNKKLGYLTIPLASLIALSRIYLCVHYPTDVLAGIILGIITAICVYAVYKYVIRKIKKQKRETVRSETNV